MLLSSDLFSGLTDVSDIKLPTKMIKRGRPKGSTENVVGLPRKKLRKGLLPFAKTPIPEKRKSKLPNFANWPSLH